MKKFLCALALLPFVSGAALAHPAQLTDTQMDKVAAGFFLDETDVSNTSWTHVLVFTPISSGGYCTDCYLNIVGPVLTIQSAFGPSATLGSAPTS